MRTHFFRNPERGARDCIRLYRIVVDPAAGADPGFHQPDSGIGVSLHEILPEAERAIAEIRKEIGDVDDGSRIELLLGDGIDRRACKDGVDQPLAQRLGLVGRRDQNDFDILSADAMMKVWIRTCRWIDDNAVQANTVAGAALGITEEVRPHLRLPYFARNGLAVLPNVWHIYYMLVAGKVLDPVDDPGRLIEQSVVEPAKRMGLPALDAVGQQPDPEVIDMLRAPYALLPNSLETYYSDWERALVRA